ncbi:MAG: MOSC domain-containing protein [Chloroflexota bacterium]|nr:MOSC domain-containing protein [Chloroflexota bacterium]
MNVAMTLEATVTRVLIGLHPLVPLAEKQASPDGRYLVSSCVQEVRATLEGLEGDRHAGFTRRADARVPQYPRGTEIHNSRHVSLVAEEELARIAANMGVPIVEPEWIGANLVLRGVPNLSSLPPLTRISFPEFAAIALEGENHPCVYPGKAIQNHYPDRPGIGKQFPKAAHHLRGVVGWVERAGMIRMGDTVRIAIPEQALYRVPELVAR